MLGVPGTDTQGVAEVLAVMGITSQRQGKLKSSIQNEIAYIFWNGKFFSEDKALWDPYLFIFSETL